MEKNFLNNYILDLLESLNQNLSSYMKVKESEYLHHLRVDIKKINAILSFAEKIFKTKYNANLLKLLFHDAGKIREIQINLNLLNAIPKPPLRLITRLRKEENTLSKEFIKNDVQYIFTIKHFRKNIRLPKLLSNKMTIAKYFINQKNKAEKILQNLDRGNLHRYRKKIKKLIYIYNALPKRIQNKIDIDIAVINKQQQWVGDWHDTYAAINFLSHEHPTILKSDYISNLRKNEKKQFDNLVVNLTNKNA
ncbi:MAG: CHAD domain-containing protein [Bacteroidetes bacterium]|nr:CHAD domain-containing protein [Bacteroidota bacterium]